MGFIQRAKERTETNERIIHNLQQFQKLTNKETSMAKSKKFTLNKEDGLKIAKGAGIAVGGALLTYLLEIVPSVDFGPYTPSVVAIISILINAGLKYIKNK